MVDMVDSPTRARTVLTADHLPGWASYSGIHIHGVLVEHDRLDGHRFRSHDIDLAVRAAAVVKTHDATVGR
jgi:hypothetical protein